MRGIAAWAGVGLLWVCVGCDDTQPCVGAENCPPDAACVAGACQPRECFSNTDCPMEQRCDLEPGQCEPGCSDDRDCYYGQTCTGGSCVTKPCTSTRLDCDAGEFCDVFTGECFTAAGPYCTSCSASEQCGGGNNLCAYVSGEGPYCLPECNADRPCPAGYDCLAIERGGGPAYYVCVTLCHYLEEVEAGAARISPSQVDPVGP